MPGVYDLACLAASLVDARRVKSRGDLTRRKMFSPSQGRVDLSLSVQTWPRERQARACSFVHHVHFFNFPWRSPRACGRRRRELVDRVAYNVANMFIDTSPSARVRTLLGVSYSPRQPRARKRARRFVPLSAVALGRRCS